MGPARNGERREPFRGERAAAGREPLKNADALLGDSLVSLARGTTATGPHATNTSFHFS